jgi:predicted peroxiredoxin
MAKILFVGTHGTDDPTKATFPFLFAKAALESGHQVGISLMGEAAPLIRDHIAAQIKGVGIAPLKELVDFLHEKKVRVGV